MAKTTKQKPEEKVEESVSPLFESAAATEAGSFDPITDVLAEVVKDPVLLTQFVFLKAFNDSEGKPLFLFEDPRHEYLLLDEDGNCYEEGENGHTQIPLGQALAPWSGILDPAAPMNPFKTAQAAAEAEDVTDAEFSIPAKPAEPERVDGEIGLSADQRMALRSPRLGGSVDGLSMIPEQAQAILATRISLLSQLRMASIQQTFPTDWLLFQNRDTGQEMAYLQDSGCERIAKLWGITVFNLSKFEKIVADDGSFAYVISGDAKCGFTGEDQEALEGIRSSDDPFFKNNGAKGARLEYYIRKAARANLDGTALRTLSGLGNVPVEELIRCGLNVEKCNKGRGYDRTPAGADVTTKDAGIPVSQYPKCPKCGGEMKFIPGRNDEQKQYDAFFGCKKKREDCGGTVKHQAWLNKVKKDNDTGAPGAKEEEKDDSGWKCEKAKRMTVEQLRAKLKSKGQTDKDLYDHLFEQFPEDGITPESLSNERAAKYISALATKLNSLG